MKKILIITFLAVFAACTANAQNVLQIEESWQKTITVPESQDPLIEKLFTAWGKEFPGVYVNAFKQYKETGKAKNVEYVGEKFNFKVIYMPKKGEIYMSSDTLHSHSYLLQAYYWDLRNGNKLFGVSVFENFGSSAWAFYEYNATNGTLTPRPDLVNKLRGIIGEDNVQTTWVTFGACTVYCNRLDASKTIELEDLLEDVLIEESIAIEKSWQKTISVPASQDQLIDKLFTAWSKEFPCMYTEAYKKFQETGKAKPIVWNGHQVDFTITKYKVNEGLFFQGTYKDFRNVKYDNFLISSIWSLKNGNILFYVFVGESVYTNMLAFYEYNPTKGTLTPRPDVTDKVWSMVGDNNKHRTYINIESYSNVIHFFDKNDKQNNKTIQWDINEF